MIIKTKESSFTLVELLVVIAIISIIAGAVLVAINPAKRLAQANDSQRWSETRSLLAAVNTFIVDNMGQVPQCSNAGGFDLPNDGVWRWVGTALNKRGGTWLLDVDIGGITPDSSWNNNDCTLNGTASIFSDPDRNEVLLLSAGDDADAGDPENGTLDFGSDSGTISFWVNLNSIPPGWTILMRKINDITNRGYDFRIDGTTNDKLYFRVNDTIPPTNSAVSNSTMNTGQWYHIVGVVDRNGVYGADDQTYLFVDGEKQNTSGDISSEPVISNDRTFKIGYSINGLIDDMAVFNYVMSEKDIQSFYNNGQGRIQKGPQFCDLTADLVANTGYLPSLPADPTDGSETNSGYLIKRDPSGAVSVKAPYASDYAEKEILVSR